MERRRNTPMKKTNRIVRKLNNLSLRRKLLSIILFCSAFVYLIVLLSMNILTNAHNRQLYRAISGNMSFSSYIIAERLESIEDLSFLVISSSTIQNSLTRINASDDAIIRSDANKSINSLLSNYQSSYNHFGVLGISLYNYIYTNSTNHALPARLSTNLKNTSLDKAAAARGGAAWTIDYESGFTLLTREVLEIKDLSLKRIGDLIIFVDLPEVIQKANEAFSTYETSAYILYDGDTLLYTSKEVTAEQADYFHSHAGNSYSILEADHHSYFVVQNTIPKYGWTYLSVIPYDSIKGATQIADRTIFMILLLGLLATLLIANRSIGYILLDFNLLVKKMEAFSGSALELPENTVDYSGRTDEVGRLHQQFDAMTHEIRDLVQTNYVNQILNRDAKLKALESQINPHFLYNTLETINWRAKALNDQKISQMTEALGTLLRATLSNKESLVSLSTEMNLVNSYMTIQRIRFEDRLLFSTDYESFPEKDALLPPLSIQPLMENSIRYGMEEMIDVCNVSVMFRISGGLLIIDVKNEGSSFEPDLLSKLKDGSISAHGHGIGLLNINERIQILFGNAYGLSFRNDDNTAVATITIPYITDKSQAAGSGMQEDRK